MTDDQCRLDAIELWFVERSVSHCVDLLVLNALDIVNVAVRTACRARRGTYRVEEMPTEGSTT